MLPSMPILFSNSQDAFGNKVEPSTSFFSQNLFQKPPETPTPPPATTVEEPPKVAAKETKGKTKSKKKEDNNATPPKITENDLETALVNAYYKKVQSKFASNLNVPTNKFVQFQNALKTFDPAKESPVDLYRKIEQIFGENSEIAEEFLLFLKPGQAAQVGRFMDYFGVNQLTGFVNALHAAYARKPTVHRKILRALNTGVNGGSSEQMKARVLPHLRSNPKLAQAFRLLFPDERPPDSHCEEADTDTLNESFLTRYCGYDSWELPGTSDDRRKLRPTMTVDTMFLHGRVFLQHGRMLRPARVTYPYSKEPYRVHARRLAPNLSHPSPSESDEECSPKRGKATPKITQKRTRKQPKSPTKTAKDVNDNTSKECVNSPRNKKATKRTKKSETETNKAKKETKSQSCKKDNQEATKAKQAKLEVVNTDKRSDKVSVDIRKGDAICLNTEAKKNEGAINPSANKSVDNQSTKSKKHESNNGADVKKSNWTRDEDKTMLQVLKGEAGSEEIFGKIKELLPHRSPSEIKERFCHVMTLLQQMAVGEVT